jgi:hypothetical protein
MCFNISHRGIVLSLFAIMLASKGAWAQDTSSTLREIITLFMKNGSAVNFAHPASDPPVDKLRSTKPWSTTIRTGRVKFRFVGGQLTAGGAERRTYCAVVTQAAKNDIRIIITEDVYPGAGLGYSLSVQITSSCP